MTSEGAWAQERHEKVLQAVTAYLKDADPEVYRWLDEASREDAMSALWTLTRIAATALQDLAAARGQDVDAPRAAGARRAVPAD